MKRKHRWIKAFGVGGLVLGILQGCHARALVDGLSADTAAPDLGISAWLNTGGRPVSLKDLRGRPVIVEFWSKDCPPCVKNLPRIKRIAAGYRGDVALLTVHVSLDRDEPNQDRAAIEAFLKEAGVSYPVGIDGGGRQWSRYDFHYLPHMVVVDARGRVRWSGNLYVHDAEKVVRRVLGEPGNATHAVESDGIPAAPVGECEGGVCAPR